MKKILIISFSCMFVFSAYSQNGNKFNYEKNKFGAYVATPIFDQRKGTGRFGVASCSDPDYLGNLMDGLTKQIITKDKVKSMHSRASYIITLGSNGEIITCQFSLSGLDRDVISDNDLYNLYVIFKKAKIDMSKVKIGSPDYSDSNTSFDYTMISGSLIPKNLRNRFLPGKQ